MDCLSKQQRKIYEMYQSGMKRKDIAKALNLNYNTVVQHIHHAEVRLQQYDRAENIVIKNNQPLDMQLTRADGLVICEALKDYIQELRSTVPGNKHEKIGNTPYQARIASDLLKRTEIAVYGEPKTVSYFDSDNQADNE